MEQIQNHKSVDSQPIWLKSVRSEAEWLDLTNPWLKEVIKSDPELISSILYEEFLPPFLLNTFLSQLEDFWCFLTWLMENHSKPEKNGSMGLHGALSLKMSTYMTETDYFAHFYYKINFSN